MTNLQAIDLLKGLEQSLDDYCELNDDGKTAFRMAITALELFGNSEQLLSAQPEHNPDDERKIADLHKMVNYLLSRLEQRWIPVSERLPEDEYVLISKKPSKITGSKWSVDIAIRTADPRSGKIQWRDSGFGVIQDDKVLAWMPRPEPYREEGGK